MKEALLANKLVGFKRIAFFKLESKIEKLDC